MKNAGEFTKRGDQFVPTSQGSPRPERPNLERFEPELSEKRRLLFELELIPSPIAFVAKEDPNTSGRDGYFGYAEWSANEWCCARFDLQMLPMGYSDCTGYWEEYTWNNDGGTILRPSLANFKNSLGNTMETPGTSGLSFIRQHFTPELDYLGKSRVTGQPIFKSDLTKLLNTKLPDGNTTTDNP